MAIQAELKNSLSLIDYSAPVEQIRTEVVSLMDAYCQAATDVGARVSSEFYNGLRQMVLGKDTTLSLQSGRSPEATERAVRAFVQKLVDEGEDGVADFEDLLLERVEYEAKRAVAYNTIENARRDPDRPRFARVPQGERTCDFCLMLASRGPVYLTAESAGAYTKFHAHCDCKVVPFWDSVEDGFSRRRGRGMSIEGYDPDALYKQYQERMKDPDFADRMRAAAHTAKDRRLSKKNGDKLSTLRSNSVIRIGDIRSSNIIRRNKQFGHKATTHRKDWIARIGALIRNPKTDGGKLKGTIATIIDKADAVVVGTTWRGQPQPRTFYRKGNDLVVVNANDVYVTVRKEGALITGVLTRQERRSKNDR